MTYNGPYTQATLMYEPDEVNAKGIVATPGTMLDYVAKNHSEFLNVMKTANLLPFYDCNDRKYTLFVPICLPQDFPLLDPNTCYRIMKYSTLYGVVTTGMLNNDMILYPLSHPRNNIDVTIYNDGEIRVRGKTILKGDIFCSNGLIHLIDGMLWPNY